MTQYMLSVYNPNPEDTSVAPDLSDDEMQEIFKAVDAFNAEVTEAGIWVFGCGLLPASSATTVQIKDGDPLITDGPFAETKEHVGGFWVLEAPDLDAALELAKKAAAACKGAVEVRPLQDEPPAS